MRLIFILWITMSVLGFAKAEDWEEFNSSLLIEVTRPNGVFTCTGVAIAPDLLATAAHCLDGEILKVRVFTQSMYDPKNDSIAVKKFKLHPKYKPKKSAYFCDLAKIHLAERLPSHIKIMPLFKGQIIHGNIYRFGFGERNKKNIRTVITPKLKRVNAEENIVELNDKFSYSGDSGGPVFLKQGQETYLLAVHSTLSFGPEGRFSYNPLLAKYQTWLFEN